MTGNKNAWRAPLAGLASLAMIATMGVAAGTANAAFVVTPTVGKYTVTVNANGGTFKENNIEKADREKALTDSLAGVDAGIKVTLNDDQTVATVKNVPADTPVSDVSFGMDTAVAGDDEVTYSNRKAAGVFSTADSAAAIDAANTKITGDLTLYPHWYVPSDAHGRYTVTFKQDANSVLGNPVTVVAGDKLADWQVYRTASTNPQQVAGWSEAVNGEDVAPAGMTIDSDKTFYVKYGQTAKVTYKNIADKEGGDVVDAENVPVDTQYVLAGKTFDAPKDVKSKDGKMALDGWYTATEIGTSDTGEFVKTWGEKFDFSSKTLAAGSETTLYAKWTATPTYHTVTFKFDNYGWFDESKTDAKNSVYGADEQVVDGQAVAVPPTPTDPSGWGREFRYWTMEDISGAEQTSAKSDYAQYNFTTPVTKDVTLYAVFGDSTAKREYTVKFDENWNKGKVTEAKTVDGKAVKPADPTRDGFKFDGWYDAAADGDEWNFDDELTGDGTTLYAHWTIAAYSELNSLLNLKNDPGNGVYVYTAASFAEYQKVVAKVVKAANDKETDSIKDGEVNESKVSEADAAEYVETLTDAKAKLQFTAEYDGLFKDVDVNTPFRAEIYTIAAQGITKGFEGGTFRPANGVNRQDFAAFLYRLAGSPAYTPSADDNKFSDVNESTPHYKEILWGAKNGVINGYGDGTFGGMRLVNRQDAAAFIYRVAKIAGNEETQKSIKDFDESKYAGVFADEAATSHKTEVLWAASQGIVKGFPDGTFQGMNTILRQDAAAFVARSIGVMYR